MKSDLFEKPKIIAAKKNPKITNIGTFYFVREGAESATYKGARNKIVQLFSTCVQWNFTW